MTGHLHNTPSLGSIMLAMVGLLEGCASPIYFAKATHGTVVDADTQQPIAGAVVVGDWEYHDWMRHGLQRFKVAEAVTDATGAYVLPGWGPRLRPRDPEFAFFPLLLVYKHGYEPARFYNLSVYEDAPATIRRMVHSSDWDGKALPIRRFQGSPKDRKLQLAHEVVDECDFEPKRPLPHLYDELLNERRFLGAESETIIIDAEPCRRGW